MRLIDADALQRKICGAKCGCEYEDCGNEGDCAFDHFIFHAPTIEAEPVRYGRWMCGDYYDIGDVCSECDWDSGMVNPTLRYCPNCGAKMDKEE